MKTKDMENKFDMLKEKERSICFEFSAHKKYLSQKKEQSKINFDNENLDISSADPKKHQEDDLNSVWVITILNVNGLTFMEKIIF